MVVAAANQHHGLPESTIEHSGVVKAELPIHSTSNIKCYDDDASAKGMSAILVDIYFSKAAGDWTRIQSRF
jgi:hypothetical protein